MRIQETDKILKEAKFARHAVAEDRGSGLSATWITAIVAVVAVLATAAFFARR